MHFWCEIYGTGRFWCEIYATGRYANITYKLKKICFTFSRGGNVGHQC